MLDDEIACFSCALVSKMAPFVPFVVSETKITPIGGIVSDIEIICDEVNINHGETVISFDSALIIKTDKGNYLFARTEWFSETILIAVDGDYNVLFPTSQVKESWENDGQNQVTVSRFSRDG